LQHMRILSGKENVVRFTNLSPTSAEALKESWKTENISATNLENGELTVENVEVTTVGVLELMKKHDVPLEKVCLLDPKAVTALSPEDGGGRFEWFLFGVSL
jgi:ribosome biogenesis SPOUT family RNA methylase Rps3